MSVIHYAISHELKRAVPIGQGSCELMGFWTNEPQEMEAFRELMVASKGGPIHILDEFQAEEFLFPLDMADAYEREP